MAIIYGTSGSDYLVGGYKDDTVDGGAGNDLLDGGLGNDIYLFDIGSGQDTISSYDTGFGKLDVVQFGGAVLPGNITITRSANTNDLVVFINGTTDALTISNYFLVIPAGSSYWDPVSGTYMTAQRDMRPYAIEEFRFADGTIWTQAQLEAINGTAGDDFLLGTTGNEVINGLAGNDTLIGNAGNDTLDGGAGNDTLAGDQGNDTYLFNVGSGQDIIHEFDMTGGSVDVVQFGAGVQSTDVTVTRCGNDLVLSINGTPDTLTIANYYGVTTTYMGNDPVTGMPIYLDARANTVEEVHFADGTIWTQTQLDTINGTSGDDVLLGTTGNDVINGLAGNDTLIGNAGNDTLDGGAGNDTLAGDQGNDTYLFNVGSGQDIIHEFDMTGGSVDVVQFGAGVRSTDVTVTRGGNDLVLSINGTPDTLTIANYYGVTTTYMGNDPVTGMPIYQDARANTVEEVHFADGTIWTQAQLDAINGTAGNDFLLGTTGNEVINGLAGNDTLIGNAGNDTLDGGAGNDTLAGDQGNDTYLFNVGSGQDIIHEFDMTGGSVDVVQFGAGVQSTDVTVTRCGNDLVLSINGTPDTLTIANYYGVTTTYMGNDPVTGMPIYQDARANTVEEVHFADGTIWTQTQLDTINGTSGDDVLLGTTGNDVINGLAGNDTLIGNAGNDTLDGGAGNDMLGGDPGNDILQGGDGSDILFDAEGSNLLNGGAGDDTLVANTGNEMFVGGSGNDTIITGDGADIIAFNRGDGMDVVNGGIGTDNTITLGGGIKYSDIALSKFNNDLILEVGNGEQITLSNWYDTSANYKNVIDLQVMADAMAGFDSTSSDPLLNQAVQTFDFTAIVNAFDQANGGNATFMHWNATSSLLATHLSSSDTMAIGGDIAHQYSTHGSFTGMNLTAAQTVLNESQFGAQAQTLRPLQGLQGGQVTL